MIRINKTRRLQCLLWSSVWQYLAMKSNPSICKSFTINYLHIKRYKSDCVDSMKSQKWEDLTFLTLLNRAGNKKCQL